MATIVLDVRSQFPPGATVSAYQDLGQIPQGAPSGSPAPVASGVVDTAANVSLDGITAARRYYAVALVGGVYRWVSFIGTTAAEGATGTLITLEGPFVGVQGDGNPAVVSALPNGTIMYETRGTEDNGLGGTRPKIVNEWVKTSG